MPQRLCHQSECELEERGGVGYLSWTLPPSVTATRIQYNTFASAALVHGRRRRARLAAAQR